VRIGWDDGDIHVRIGSHRAALRFFTCLQNGPHFETSVDPVAAIRVCPWKFDLDVGTRIQDPSASPWT
jgi:hypothetical protein